MVPTRLYRRCRMKKLVLLTAGVTVLAGATGVREWWACAAFLWFVLWMVVPD